MAMNWISADKTQDPLTTELDAITTKATARSDEATTTTTKTTTKATGGAHFW